MLSNNVEIKKGSHAELFSLNSTLKEIYEFLKKYPDFYNSYESDNGLDEFIKIRIIYSRRGVSDDKI